MPTRSDPPGQAARVLKRIWPAVAVGDVEAVHRARVATRRLREALRASGAERRSARRLRKELRRLTRALGPVRELDVSLGLVARLSHEEAASDTALELIRVHLMEVRARCRARMLKRVDDTDAAGIAARWEALAGAARQDGRASSPRAGAPEAWELRRCLARRAAQLRLSLEEAGALYTPEPLHAVRIAVKKLRYSVELARSARIAGATARARRLKTLQDLLGELHDWQVLEEHVGDVQSSLPVQDGRMGELTSLLSSLEDRCRALHGAFLARRPDLIALCEALESEDDSGLSPTRTRDASHG